MAIIADIVAELKKGGPLKNPFERLYPSNSPIDYVEIEVRKCIDRIQLLRTYKSPPDRPKVLLGLSEARPIAAQDGLFSARGANRRFGSCSARAAAARQCVEALLRQRSVLPHGMVLS